MFYLEIEQAFFLYVLLVIGLIYLFLYRSKEIFEVMVEEIPVVILDSHKRVYRYNKRWKAIYPKTRFGKHFEDCFDNVSFLSKYRAGSQFAMELNDINYFVMSRMRNTYEIISLRETLKILESGSVGIRKIVDDFDMDPIDVQVDPTGQILDVDYRIRNYMWLFDTSSLYSLHDMGLGSEEINDFLNGIIAGIHVDQRLKIYKLDFEIFYLVVHSYDNDRINLKMNFSGTRRRQYGGVLETMQNILESMEDGLLTCDVNGKILFSNRQMKHYVGSYSLVSKNINDVMVLLDENNIRIPLTFPMVEFMYPYVWITSDTSSIRNVTELTITDVYDADGHKEGYIFNFRDPRVRERKREELDNFVYRDSLTGAYNRHFFDRWIRQNSVVEMERVAWLMIDCNGLKLVNDTFGHDAGDQLIQASSRFIRNHLKDSDYLIRSGGDEFVVFLKDYTYDEVQNLISRLKADSKEIVVLYVPLSFAIGEAYHESGVVDMQGMINDAELKMYRDKVLMAPVSRNEILNALMQELFVRSPWEEEHGRYVAYGCHKMAQSFKLGEEMTELVMKAGLYHNIGKIGLRKEVMDDLGVSLMYKKEYDLHTQTAYRILSAIPEYSYLANSVLHYKEHYDGSGGPGGLKGSEIPLSSRILSVVSRYHKLIAPANKQYKQYSRDMALKMILSESGTRFDPRIVAEFLKIVDDLDNYYDYTI